MNASKARHPAVQTHDRVGALLRELLLSQQLVAVLRGPLFISEMDTQSSCLLAFALGMQLQIVAQLCVVPDLVSIESPPDRVFDVVYN